MSRNDPIEKLFEYGFEHYGEGFGIILFGLVFLINSGMIPWLSDNQKKGIRGYLDAQNESRPPTKDEEFYHLKFLTFKAGIFFVALGLFFILFQPKLSF